MPDPSGNWDNDPQIHCNRFPPELLKTPEELKREKHAKCFRETHSVTSIDKLPETACYAVLINETYTYITGYGRNGEFDDTGTGRILELTTFDTQEALEAWVLENTTKKNFKVVYLKPVKIEVKAVFSLEK